MKRCLSFFLLSMLLVSAGCASTPAPASSPSSSAPAASVSPAIEKLIVGLDDTFAPMGFRDTANNLIGFDIDLATAVGMQLGAEIVFQPIDWTAKEMELTSKKIDCIWNGMSKTPEREESMQLSQPYLNNKIIIMTTEGVAVNSMDDLTNYKIGTQAGSSALEMLQADAIYESVKDSVTEYPTYDECILDMQSGRVQVMVVDEVLGKYKNSVMENQFTVSDVNFGEDYYVIGFRKEDTELCAAVENAIKAVIASGEAKTISEKWFGQNIMLDLK